MPSSCSISFTAPMVRPSSLPKKFNGITASFGKGVSYATLYNPNYVGSYVALVLPLTIYEAVQDEKNRYKIVAAASAVCQLIMLKGSWHSSSRDDDGNLYMSKLSVDIFAQKIEYICDKLGYKKRTRQENKDHLSTLVKVTPR